MISESVPCKYIYKYIFMNYTITNYKHFTRLFFETLYPQKKTIQGVVYNIKKNLQTSYSINIASKSRQAYSEEN